MRRGGATITRDSKTADSPPNIVVGGRTVRVSWQIDHAKNPRPEWPWRMRTAM